MSFDIYDAFDLLVVVSVAVRVELSFGCGMFGDEDNGAAVAEEVEEEK